MNEKQSRKQINNSAEGKVYNYFKNKKYSICLGKFISNDKGSPDFFIEKDNDKFWVEVKTRLGSLSCEQIEWMINYNDQKIFIAIVKEITNSLIKFVEIKASEANL